MTYTIPDAHMMHEFANAIAWGVPIGIAVTLFLVIGIPLLADWTEKK